MINSQRSIVRFFTNLFTLFPMAIAKPALKVAVKKINRTEFIDQLATKLTISKAKAEEMLSAFIELVTENLIGGTEVNLTGFGVFRPVARKARDGVNPKNGTKMKIKASKGVGFKVGKTLKEAVKNS